jgi:transposase
VIYGKVRRMDEDLQYAPRAELLAIIAAQREQIAALEAQVGTLVARVTELEQRDPPAWAKPNRPKRPEPRPARKRRGTAFVRRRDAPTAVLEHAADHCPDCGMALAGGWVRWRRQVIDLPLAPATVTEHVVLARRCPACHTTITPALDLSAEVLGRHRVSLRLMGLIAVLREQLRLPVAAIQDYLALVHQLQLSSGEIVAVLATVARQAQTAATAIRDAVRRSPVVHGDETGWREQGQNGYLWGFSTPRLRYFTQGNRSKAMVDAVLGEDFAGVLVTDFYAAYDHYPGPHQRCWVHLLRDIHELKRTHPTDVALVQWGGQVKALYERAKRDPGPPARWSAKRQTDWRREQQHAAEAALAALCRPYAGQPVPQRVLCERILKYLPELFTFLADPRVPADNNAAERSLRPSVVRRKISGGTRSAAGTLCRTVLWTVTETWRLQGKPLLDAWMALLRDPAAAPV